MTMTVRWPDGAVQEHYSPSLVVRDYLAVGGCYTVSDFVDRSTTALAEASERVRAKFGFACTAAAASAERIVQLASSCAPQDTVTVIAMQPEPANRSAAKEPR
ncbi:MSMEG_0570 family nitrogen starvation response protein [Amycolatopsis sp. SID8362]|uniref:MSMEG_0570 family nitrogen starvation response protein n=1 Tax=Amycolatopsis sp. SID8362 TaxID=2690346 RepID=UPI0014150888|nr:MSMEG_0570 family nitrogen starvation response protein [Amycolatopsis sp. SID8362]